MLKMKFNKKTKEQLDFETLKKVSKGKLSTLLDEAQSDMLSTDKKSRDNLEKIYKNLEKLSLEHHRDDKDYSEELQSDPEFDESTEYDDLEESDDE